MSRETGWRLAWVLLFAVTMGFFEASVVVYLRAVLGSEGVSFPLRPLPPPLLAVELGREAASLVMIGSVAVIAGRNWTGRLAYGLVVFGTWDILYYVFLKAMLDWPASLMTTDLLFLIPLPWIGPVLAPALVAAVMVAAGVTVLRLEDLGAPIRVTRWNLAAEALCALLIVVSFCLEGPAAARGEPGPFSWPLFLAGLLPAVGLFAWEVARALRARRDRGPHDEVKAG